VLFADEPAGSLAPLSLSAGNLENWESGEPRRFSGFQVSVAPGVRAGPRSSSPRARVAVRSGGGAGPVGAWKSGILRTCGTAAHDRFSDFQDPRSPASLCFAEADNCRGHIEAGYA
jgi:hypothetical protein